MKNYDFSLSRRTVLKRRDVGIQEVHYVFPTISQRYPRTSFVSFRYI